MNDFEVLGRLMVEMDDVAVIYRTLIDTVDEAFRLIADGDGCEDSLARIETYATELRKEAAALGAMAKELHNGEH